MSWDDKWKDVIFSDEKRFCLDGPDGHSYYFHDIRKEELNSFNRQMGGGGVMCWGAFGYNKKSDLVLIDGRIDSKKYTNMLEERFLPFAVQMANENWIFQQDNCSVHVSKFAHKWFLDHAVTLLDWPSCSPDLNPMENMWGNLSRIVYQHGKQYNTVDQLKSAILESWEKITTDECRKLINSMQNRIFELILKKGGHTSY